MTEAFNLHTTNLNTSILIEASAGTGKTYSLTHIIIRLLVENKIPIEQILVVTFTKSATAQMRDRLRSLLSDFCNALDDGELFNNLSSDLQILHAKWVDSGIAPTEIESCLREAIAHIEDASIYTIHGFCQRMLQDFVFASQGTFEMEVSDASDIKLKATDEVVRNLITKFDSDEDSDEELLKFLRFGQFTEFLNALDDLSLTKSVEQQARIITDLGFTQPVARSTDTYTLTDALSDFIKEAPDVYKRLKNEAQVKTFSDMLVDMEKQLDIPEFRKAIQDKFKAVLIDEFQDTDPIQYNIFKTLFLKEEQGKAAQSQNPLIFVGDPKQSIYGFRSADLRTYLRARSTVYKKYLLKRNFRSAPGLVKVVNRFFSDKNNQSCFLNEISYEPVEFNPNKQTLLQINPDDNSQRPISPFKMWVYNPSTSETDFKKQNKALIQKQEARLIADEIQQLTENNVYICEENGNKRPLHYSDICILVRWRRDAKALMNELQKRTIRYIIKSDENVFTSPEASEIRQVLAAIENPKDRNAMTVARATCIFGQTLKDIAEQSGSDNSEGALRARLIIENAREDIIEKGVLTAFNNIFRVCDVEQRLLKTVRGERALTNYQHILELLHSVNRKTKTVSGLLRWLSEQTQSPESDDAYKLRLESDSDLIRIETIHNSKGLEFPVVFILNSASKPWPLQSESIFSTEENNQRIKLLYAGDTSPTIGQHFENKTAYIQDYVQEEIRLLYVAMTRASCYLGLPFLLNPWLYDHVRNVKKFFSTFASTPERILTAKENPQISDTTNVLNADAAVTDSFRNTLSQPCSEQCNINCGTIISVDPLISETQTRTTVQGADYEANQTALLEAEDPQSVSVSWIRTSFTALAHQIEENKNSPAQDEGEFPTDSSEINSDNTVEPATEIPVAFADPFRYRRKGSAATAYGDFIHKLLESITFSDTNKDSILNHVTKFFEYHGIQSSASDVSEQDLSSDELKKRHIQAISDMVYAVLTTRPLPSNPEFQLSLLKPEQKVSEMDFLLSNNIKNNKQPLTAKNLSDALEILDKAKYGDLSLGNQLLTGYLTGSIDLAFIADDKFWIIDWKTNHVSDNLDDYRNQKGVLEETMVKNHYKLQYLLYLVALKRHLEQRFKVANQNYDVYDHIGGVAYFFLRGIQPNSGSYGIYFDRPAREVLDCIDELLKHGYDKNLVQQYRNKLKQADK